MKQFSVRFPVVAMVVILSFSCAKKLQVKLVDQSPQASFAVAQLQNSIQSEACDYTITLKEDQTIQEQSFSIKTYGSQIKVVGGDALGLMYGGLELAEIIDLKYDLSNLDIQKSPHHKKRGLKFNIPLDARCPSYDDTGDAAQSNIINMWDFTFWKEYFDHMAMHRYNVLSLWSPNPFQVMIKLPDYPSLALDDVCRTKSVPTGKVGEWSDAGGVNDVVLNKLEIIKEMTIDEKIAHWQKVFDYAVSRGIDIYCYTWNIYTNGTFGQYGLSDEINNPKTKAYYRQAINVFLQTYPQIKGIGVTAGERMHVPKGEDEADAREKWLWDTYGEGIQDYKKEHPNRSVHFVHRVWYSKFDQIMKYWGEYTDPFDVGFKYCKARIYSSPMESPFIGGLKKGLLEHELKCWWNLRNDDIFVYRWGDPDYTREFLANLPQNVTAGYHMGADGYVFGRVFADKEPTIKGTLEFDKHWYKFMLWGRLGYDNQMTNEHFVKMLEHRYQTDQSNMLFNVWQMASKVVPQINRFIYHTGDRHWQPEMCSSRESFKYTPCFRIASSMPQSGVINPIRLLQLIKQDKLSEQFVTPTQIVDSLHSWSDFVLLNVTKLAASNIEMKSVKADLEAFAWLGKYYAQKIRAATLMEAISEDGDSDGSRDFLNAIMQKATEYWKNYASVSDQFYHPQMFSRVNVMDWKALERAVVKDEQMVRTMYDERSLKSLKRKVDPKMSVVYPMKGITKKVVIKTIIEGEVELLLFDQRGEMVNNYTYPGVKGEQCLVWEDLAWMPKGKYTLVLYMDGKTAIAEFKK